MFGAFSRHSLFVNLIFVGPSRGAKVALGRRNHLLVGIGDEAFLLMALKMNFL